MILCISIISFLTELTAVSLLSQRITAVDSGTVNDALGQIERISGWPAQTVIVGLFVFLIVCCVMAVKTTRKDMQDARSAADKERTLYYTELQALHEEAKADRREMIKVLERNNLLFERIERGQKYDDRTERR